jgi:hypothetical protein
VVNLTREPTIYLVDECDDPDYERACLQAVYATIFEDQFGWLVARSRHAADASVPVRLPELV